MADPAFLLDANICIYLLAGRPLALLDKLQSFDKEQLATSAIGYAEVLKGVHGAEATQKAGALFELIRVLPFEARQAEIYAKLPFRRGGFDRLIAAHALSLDLTLVTNNERDFADVPGLRTENWAR